MNCYDELAELLDMVSLPFENKNICEKAKDLLMSYSFHHSDLCDYYDYLCYLDNCKSPIEQIFYIAYILFCSKLKNIEIEDFGLDFIMLEEIYSQKVIAFKNNKYVIDFVIDFSKKDKLNDYIYPKIKNLKYAIELDGFDYHSNKKQMNYDYERENNLKLLGFNVVRFTGSQIYENPYKCILKLVKIIAKDIQKEMNENE